MTCPEGRQSISWLPSIYPKSGMQFEARFGRNDCAACPKRSRCTRSKVEPRIITLQFREDFDALQSARRNQATEEFRNSYAGACRYRRHACTGDSSVRRAQMPLCRAGEDALATRHCSRRTQPDQSRRVAQRHSFSTHAYLTVCGSTGGGLIGLGA